MSQVNIALEIYGILVSMVLLICCYVEKSKADTRIHYLVSMLMLNMLVLFCDMLTWIFDNRVEYTLLLYIANFLVYSLGYIILSVFTCYLLSLLSAKVKTKPNQMVIIVLLCSIAIGLVVISLFNKMYFSFDNGIYVRGPYFWFSQAFPVIVILVDMVIILRYSKVLGLHDTCALLSYGVLPMIAMVIQILVYGITLLYLSTTLSLLIIFLMIHAEQEKRIKELELEQTQQQISIMLSQIQPHFLFNALNTIQYLCETQPEVATKAIESFAKFLRGNMDSLTQKKPISVEQEILHVKQYLTIEQLRFDNVKIEYNLETVDFCIPPLTIQPIVENAIRYGITAREEGGTVKITTREDKYNYFVVISDDGVGIVKNCPEKEERSHIGIENTRNRIETMCNGEMVIDSIQGEGTTVTIIVPKKGNME